MIGTPSWLQRAVVESPAAYPDDVDLIVPLRRWGYRAAYAGLRGYWFIARPQTRGVKCVLTDGDRVLLVRHTYGPPGWDLPGGSIKRGETAAAAASREMSEELGITVASWRTLGRYEIAIDHRRDVVHCFQAELDGPELVVDHGELAATRWFPKHELPRDLGRYSRRILERFA
jgi:8-oxo-dGTP pyrophosphatase MutT (NUDIX family)